MKPHSLSSFDRPALLSAVRLANKALPLSQGADGIDLRLADGTLTATAGDRDMSCSAWCAGAIDKPWRVVARAGTLNNFLTMLTDETVNLALDGPRLVVEQTCGLFRPGTVGPQNTISPVTEGQNLVVNAQQFSAAVKNASEGIDQRGERGGQAGVRVEVSEGQLRLIALDAIHLIVASIPCSGENISFGLPYRAARALQGGFGDGEMTITVANIAASFNTPAACLTTALINLPAIQYEAMMPARKRRVVEMDRQKIIALIDLAMVSAPDLTVVRIRIAGAHAELLLTDEHDFSWGRMPLAVTNAGGIDTVIAVSAELLLHAARAHSGDTISLDIGNPHETIIIDARPALYHVLAPTQIRPLNERKTMARAA